MGEKKNTICSLSILVISLSHKHIHLLIYSINVSDRRREMYLDLYLKYISYWLESNLKSIRESKREREKFFYYQKSNSTVLNSINRC